MTQEQEIENKQLFSFMKDNDKWRLSIDENGKCTYHNPINSKVYGLMFHKDPRWVMAAFDKFSNKVLSKNFQLDMSIAPVMKHNNNDVVNEEDTICLIVKITDWMGLPHKLFHAHGIDYYAAMKKVLIQGFNYMNEQQN